MIYTEHALKRHQDIWNMLQSYLHTSLGVAPFLSYVEDASSAVKYLEEEMKGRYGKGLKDTVKKQILSLSSEGRAFTSGFFARGKLVLPGICFPESEYRRRFNGTIPEEEMDWVLVHENVNSIFLRSSLFYWTGYFSPPEDRNFLTLFNEMVGTQYASSIFHELFPETARKEASEVTKKDELTFRYDDRFLPSVKELVEEEDTQTLMRINTTEMLIETMKSTSPVNQPSELFEGWFQKIATKAKTLDPNFSEKDASIVLGRIMNKYLELRHYALEYGDVFETKNFDGTWSSRKITK